MRLSTAYEHVQYAAHIPLVIMIALGETLKKARSTFAWYLPQASYSCLFLSVETWSVAS